MGGTVLVDGRPVEQWSRAEFARRVSYVPQGHTPPFPFKVWEVTAMGRNPYQRGIGRLSREDRRVVAEAWKFWESNGWPGKFTPGSAEGSGS